MHTVVHKNSVRNLKFNAPTFSYSAFVNILLLFNGAWDLREITQNLSVECRSFSAIIFSKTSNDAVTVTLPVLRADFVAETLLIF